MNFDKIDNITLLDKAALTALLTDFTPEDAAYAVRKSRAVTDAVFGRKVYIRGLIEISNICKNDCLYCGIRRSNKAVDRYRMDKETILSCCDNGYAAGFRTFVLQGGEDAFFTDAVLTDLVYSIKEKYPDCAVTLSLGERSKDSYRALFAAGADRYLLRHETACEMHYRKLHPKEMSFQKRMDCLAALKEIGYQTGCGMMVGSPFQTPADLAEDLMFIRSFRPQMVGMGPFIPAANTPFADQPTGSIEMTLFLLSLVRLILPPVLLPATTALQTLLPDGRVRALNAGANVVMPNLSPAAERKKYALYEHKEAAFFDSSDELTRIKEQLGQAGYQILTDRGDYTEL